MTVLIVGGGIAGLTAAYQFEKYNISYKIIEADRWGGRILTQDIEENDEVFKQDMGAEYFLSHDKALLDLISDLGLPTAEYMAQRAIFDSKDEKFMILPSSQDSFWTGIKKKLSTLRYLGLKNFSSAKKLQSKLPAWQDEISFLYDSLQSTTLESIYSEAAAKFSHITNKDLMQYLQEEGFSQQFIRKMIDPLFHAIYMMDCEELNALFGILGFASKNAKIFHVKDGNQKLIDAMLDKISPEDRIKGRVESVEKVKDAFRVEIAGQNNNFEGGSLFLAIPHAALSNIEFRGLTSKEHSKIEFLQSIEYNSAVFHHLIRGSAKNNIGKIFAKGADTVFIANPKGIVEINAISFDQDNFSGIFDITSPLKAADTNFSEFFETHKIIKTQHWKNAYPKFTKDYFDKYPKPKISDNLFCGADSFVSSLGNSVLIAKLIADEIKNDYEKDAKTPPIRN